MRRRTAWTIPASLVLFGAACTSSGDVSDAGDAIAPSAPTTTASITTAPTTTASSASTAPWSTEPLLPPAAPVEEVELEWNTTRVDGVEATRIVGVAPGVGLLVFEETGRTVEGCEADTDPEHRLVLIRPDGTTLPLLDPALPRDSSIGIGPGGRTAIVATCDANAWLAAIGTLGPDGLSLIRLPAEPETRLATSGNDVVRLGWSVDGDTLFFNGTEVDATTGELLDADAAPGQLEVLAELASGGRLVGDAGERWREFHFVPAGSTLTRSPILFEEPISPPSPAVSVAGDRSAVAIAVDTWDEPAIRRTIVLDDDGGITAIEGLGMLSPDGDQLLVADEAGQRLVDLVHMTSAHVPDSDQATGAAWFDDETLWLWTWPDRDSAELELRLLTLRG